MDRNWKTAPLKLFVVCKTFQGEEFVEAMIESLYNHVEKIVFVNSEISWTNERGNEVVPVISQWKKKNDNLNKIINLPFNSTSQINQYKHGTKYIREHFEYDFLMVVDTDEIWEEQDIIKCKKYLVEHYADDVNAYTVKMRTYIKSPFYRLKNIETCKPTVFIKNGCSVDGVRGNSILPRKHIDGVYMHHFTYVRKNNKKVLDKILSSTLADGLKTVDINDWVENKWNKLPDPTITNLHTSAGYEQYWSGVEIVNITDLPSVFQKHNFDILEQYKGIDCGLKETHYDFINFYNSDYYENIPYGELVMEDEKILFDVSSKSQNILEIGTFLGRSSLILANQKYNRNVDSLDIFEDIESITDPQNKIHYSFLFNKHPHYYKNIKQQLEKHNINVMKRDDAVFSKLKQYDAIFFDGDHSYAGVKKDFEDFYPYLKNGGLLVFHDSFYSEMNPCHGVFLFIKERIQPHFTKILEGGSATVWKINCLLNV